MQFSTAGLAQLAREEGTRLDLYDDPAGHCTIGVGHLVHLGGCDGRASEIPFRDGISQLDAESMLAADVAPVEAAVSDEVTVPLTQNQFDALISFGFNVGIPAFRSSTLLRRLNAGDYAGAADEFARWTRGGGEVLPGLVARRAREAATFRASGAAAGIALAAIAAAGLALVLWGTA